MASLTDKQKTEQMEKILMENLPSPHNKQYAKKKSKSISNVSELSKQAHKLGQKNIDVLMSYNKKENMLKDLRRDFKFQSNQKLEYLRKLESVTNFRIESEKNKIEMTKYCDSIREKYKDFIQTIEGFEKSLFELQKEKEAKQKQNEELKQFLKKQKEKLQRQIDKTNEKIKQQQENIEQLELKFRQLERQKEEEKKELIISETRDIDKYNALFKVYRETLNKYNVFEHEESNKEVGELAQIRKEFRSNLVKEQQITKLNEYKLQYEKLEKEYNELTEENNNLQLNNYLSCKDFQSLSSQSPKVVKKSILEEEEKEDNES